MSKYVAFANKCWPAFQTEFKFVPCYVNSRLASRLMPVSCEVDIYGALSEYICACATEVAPHAAGHQQLGAARHVRGRHQGHL